MKKAFVDTSAWYAFIKPDDPDHAAVKAAIGAWEGRLVTSNFVFDEVVTLVRARMGISVAARVGNTLKDAGLVELLRILPEDEDDAWTHFTHCRDKAYSFTDCTSFVMMNKLHLHTAIATDRNFRQAGFRVEP